MEEPYKSQNKDEGGGRSRTDRGGLAGFMTRDSEARVRVFIGARSRRAGLGCRAGSRPASARRRFNDRRGLTGAQAQAVVPSRPLEMDTASGGPELRPTNREMA